MKDLFEVKFDLKSDTEMGLLTSFIISILGVNSINKIYIPCPLIF